MKILISAFALVGTVGSANAGLFVQAAVPGESDPVPSHLQPATRATLTYKFSIPAGATNVRVFYAVAPETGTQRNAVTRADIFPGVSRRPVSEDLLERKEIVLHTSDGDQPGGFLQYKPANGDTTLTNASKVEVSMGVNLYQYTKPPTTVGPFAGAKLRGNTAIADAASKPFRDWLARNRLDPENRSKDPMTDIPALLYAVGGIPYHAVNKMDAASVVVSHGGDCGSKSGVFEAELMAFHIPARLIVGWLLRPNGTIDRHVRVEFLYRGWWTPIEPTGYRRGMDPMLTVGVSGREPAAHFITDHIGLELSSTFDDRDGEDQNVTATHLQSPEVVYTLYGRKVRVQDMTPAIAITTIGR